MRRHIYLLKLKPQWSADLASYIMLIGARYALYSGPSVHTRNTTIRYFPRNLREYGWLGQLRAQSPWLPDDLPPLYAGTYGLVLDQTCQV